MHIIGTNLTKDTDMHHRGIYRGWGINKNVDIGDNRILYLESMIWLLFGYLLYWDEVRRLCLDLCTEHRGQGTDTALFAANGLYRRARPPSILKPSL